MSTNAYLVRAYIADEDEENRNFKPDKCMLIRISLSLKERNLL